MSTNTTGYRDEHEFHDRVERRLHSARDYASVMHCYGTDDVHLPSAAADDPFTFEAGTVLAKLIALQDRVAELSKDKAYIDSVIKNNAEKAQYFANKTLRKVQKKIGFPERIR